MIFAQRIARRTISCPSGVAVFATIAGSVTGRSLRTHRISEHAPAAKSGAAKESNLPTRGLHGPAGFEDRMGHQTPAAPRWNLDPRGRRPEMERAARRRPVRPR